MSTKRRLDDKAWLTSVRVDLDSNADDWVVRTNPNGVSKLQSIGYSLDVILTELGYPAMPHMCSKCGKPHRAA